MYARTSLFAKRVQALVILVAGFTPVDSYPSRLASVDSLSPESERDRRNEAAKAFFDFGFDVT